MNPMLTTFVSAIIFIEIRQGSLVTVSISSIWVSSSTVIAKKVEKYLIDKNETKH